MDKRNPQPSVNPTASKAAASAETVAVNVKVRFFTTLREIVGRKEEQFTLQASSTVEDLLHHIIKTYGQKLREYLYDGDQLRPQFQILINGLSIDTSTSLNTVLQDESTVAILPPAGGG
ncbi:MAG: ubiquitin-like small modifier protein 1 [Candidatus Bathyarchaeia archaeon]